MLFDDRLATVLRTSARSEAGLRTQFRQLVDLLGTRPQVDGGVVESAAYLVVGAIQGELAEDEQSRILRQPGLRIRNQALVAMLADGPPKPAAAAMATARLAEEDWLDLIPRLPVTARGFLRHRRDLSPPVRDLLVKLGVGDLVLPDPGLPASDAAETVAKPGARSRAGEGIGELLRRIESFRQGRSNAPPLPMAELEQPDPHGPQAAIEFVTDPSGEVVEATEAVAPLLAGLRLTTPRPGPLVQITPRFAALVEQHQVLTAEPVTVHAAEPIVGEWRIDAVPLFHPQTGGFTGYSGCLRRPVFAPEADSEGDLMRQVLHELRTPVNAIQGFAEIIQQQLFGPAPNAYRAHAAAINVDAAKLLAGFDEVDRLVKLEGGAMEMDAGECDFREVLTDTVSRMDAVLRSRNSGFRIEASGSLFTIALDRSEALALAWRLLATAAGGMAPGEEIVLHLTGDGERVTLSMNVPAALLAPRAADPADPSRNRAVSAGMFGPSFSFQLAQAEARAAGGSLECGDKSLMLELPALTGPVADHSATVGTAGT